MPRVIVIPVSISTCGYDKLDLLPKRSGGKRLLGDFLEEVITERLKELGVDPSQSVIVVEDAKHPERAIILDPKRDGRSGARPRRQLGTR